jgi:pimeloyl-ACP methyl ester carboxylesterase
MVRKNSAAIPASPQPIVILGGFASLDTLYVGMRAARARCTGQAVSIVPAWSLDWLPGVRPEHWKRILDKLGDTVQRAASASPTGKVTLIGHSAGGVLARFYLSPKPLMGRAYRGIEYVDHLITLGSPHTNQSNVMFGGRLSQWVNRHCPGVAFAPQVRYTSVIGRAIRGRRWGGTRARLAYLSYRGVCGEGGVWGDGVVPARSAWLPDSQRIVLEDVSHFAGFGRRWYGSRDVIGRWWKECTR